MAGPKPAALPLGDVPLLIVATFILTAQKPLSRNILFFSPNKAIFLKKKLYIRTIDSKRQIYSRRCDERYFAYLNLCNRRIFFCPKYFDFTLQKFFKSAQNSDFALKMTYINYCNFAINCCMKFQITGH